MKGNFINEKDFYNAGGASSYAYSASGRRL